APVAGVNVRREHQVAARGRAAGRVARVLAVAGRGDDDDVVRSDRPDGVDPALNDGLEGRPAGGAVDGLVERLEEDIGVAGEFWRDIGPERRGVRGRGPLGGVVDL